MKLRLVLFAGAVSLAATAVFSARFRESIDVLQARGRLGAIDGIAADILNNVEDVVQDGVRDASAAPSLNVQDPPLPRASAAVKRKTSNSSIAPSTSRLRLSAWDQTRAKRNEESRNYMKKLYHARLETQPEKNWEISRVAKQLKRLRKRYGALSPDVEAQVRREARMDVEERIIDELGGRRSLYASEAERDEEREALAELAKSGPRAVLEGFPAVKLTRHRQKRKTNVGIFESQQEMMRHALDEAGGNVPDWAVHTASSADTQPTSTPTFQPQDQPSLLHFTGSTSRAASHTASTAFDEAAFKGKVEAMHRQIFD